MLGCIAFSGSLEQKGGDASSNKGKPATKKQLEGLEKGWKEAEKRKRKVICLETLLIKCFSDE